VAGEPVRLLVEGGPSIGGRTMADKLAWLRRHGERLRRGLMTEPRGHAGMHGALLTEPVTPGAHAGILFMHGAGFPRVSGEGVIAAVTIAIEHRLIHLEGGGELLLDTPAGLVRARPRFEDPDPAREGRVSSVAITGFPSFVSSAGMPVQTGARALRVDIAFSGESYAIVDSESIGVPVDAAHASQLVRAGRELQEAVDQKMGSDPILGIQGVIFTAPPRGAADLRSATVLDGGVLRRSPGAAGTCALLAVLDAMGLVTGDHRFTHEGIIGTTLQASVLSRQTSGDIPTVVPVLEGCAWITGRHEFDIDERDPLNEGFAFI
jgi:proline racemase